MRGAATTLSLLACAVLSAGGGCGREGLPFTDDGGTGADLRGGADGGARDLRGPSTWRIEKSGVTTALRGVWGRSPADVFAVGDGNVIVHSDGTGQWKLEKVPNAGDLVSVAGQGSTVIAVGQDGPTGEIVRFQPGGGWRRESASQVPPFPPLRAVWVGPSGQAVAVGTSLRVMVSDTPGAWRLVSTEGTRYGGGFGVWGSSPNDVWIVGPTMRLVRSSTSGATWMDVASPEPVGTLSTAIAGGGAQDVWVVSADCCAREGRGSAYHGDGSGKWRRVALPDDERWPIAAISVDRDGTAYAVAGRAVLAGRAETGLAVILPDALQAQALHGVWAQDGHVYAVGDAGTIYHRVP